MYAIEFVDGSSMILTNASNFKINEKMKLVLFKRGFKNVSMYELSKIKSINGFEKLEELLDYRNARTKGLI